MTNVRSGIALSGVALASIFLLAACSSDDDKGSSSSSSGASSSSSGSTSSSSGSTSSSSSSGSSGTSGDSFDCPDDPVEAKCDSATQYCLAFRSRGSDGSITQTGQCKEKPSGCNGCECAQEDADPDDACALIGCDTRNSAITVTCSK